MTPLEFALGVLALIVVTCITVLVCLDTFQRNL